jgi:threonine/homoserine/homoserine lactone efflux protein
MCLSRRAKQLTADVLPFALGIAASPFPIIPAILLLLTPRPRANGSAFLAGWVTGIVLATVVFTALGSSIGPREQTSDWVSWTRVLLGLLLLALSVRQWLSRKDKPDTPSWLQAIDQSTPRSSLRLGVLLSAANPKILLLAAAAGLSIASSDLSTTQMTATIAVFTVVAASTVALPLVLHAVLGERMLVPLGKAKDWLVAHNATVMAVVIALIGLYLLVNGLADL